MKKLIVPILLLCGSAAMIALGAAFGQYSDVLAKAIRVCLECIGLG